MTEIRGLLDRARSSRGALKRVGAEVDADPELARALVADARSRGVDLPSDAASWPGKKLVRACLDRTAEAQRRTNPIRRDEAFTCVHCGVHVPRHGRTARDHCPHCLRSVHVDVVPGDRAAGCGGVLDPVAIEVRGDDWMIVYRCRACGASRRNRALRDGQPADDPAALAAVAAGATP